MRVSVVIVHYRDAERLLALLGQLPDACRGSDCEVIVVDNASGDPALLERVRRDHPSVQLIVNAENVGFGSGMNIGVEAAQGEVVLLLNPDVELRAGFLPPLLASLERPGIGVVGPAVFRPDGRRQLTGHRRFPTLTTVCVEYCLPLQVFLSRWLSGLHPHDESVARHKVSHATAHLTAVCLLAKREIFRQLGGFDRGFFLYLEETDLQRRLQQRGLTVWYCAEASLVHFGSIGKRFAQANPHFLASLQRYWRLWYPLTGTATLRATIATASVLSLLTLLVASPLAFVKRSLAGTLGRYARGYVAIFRWLATHPTT